MGSAIQHLSEGLRILFFGHTRSDAAAAGSEEGGGDSLGELETRERPVAPDGLLLIVERDQFRYGELELGFDSGPTRKLAGDLYDLGVKSIHILPEVTRDELGAFLELTCLAPDEIEEKGGIVDASKGVGVENVVLGIAQDLSMVEWDDVSEDVDLLEYLRNKQALRHSPTATGDAYDLPEDESEDVSDIREFFLDVAKGSEDKRRHLFQTLGDSTRLAETLNHIHSAGGPHRSGDDDGGKGRSTELLRDTFKTVAGIIKSLPEETGQSIIEKMGEAILTTDARTHSDLMKNSLSSHIGTGAVEDKILSTMPDGKVAEALGHHVRFHNGTANTISNFLEEFSSDPRRRTAIRHMLARLLSEEDDERIREAVALLETAPQHVSSEGARKREPEKIEIDPAQRSALTAELRITEEEIDDIEIDVEADFRYETELHAARSIFELFLYESMLPVGDSAVRFFAALMGETIKKHSYDFVSEILQVIVEEMPRRSQAQLRSVVRGALAACGKTEHFDEIIHRLRARDSRSPEYQRLLFLVKLMGDSGAELLFNRIEKEENHAKRLFLVGLFAELGEEKLPYLSRKLRSDEWYVVRNVVFILGKIRSEMAVDDLRDALDHRDMRVRREALRALSAVGGARAKNTLLGLLSDPEAVTRRLAAEWLGTMADKSVLPRFVEMISDRADELMKDPEYAIGVVRAIGMLGGPEELALLKRFVPRRSVFRGNKILELIEACKESIARLEDESATVLQELAQASKRSHANR